jgi:hypothetical protein
MTRVVGQPDSLPNADTLGKRRTIASIEMLDAIELEARVGQLITEAVKPSHAMAHWLRLWITTWWPRS